MRRSPRSAANARSRAERGIRLFAAGRYAEALRLLSAATRGAGSSCDWALPAQAGCALSLGQPLKALSALERYSVSYPREPRAAIAALEREALRQARASGLMERGPEQTVEWTAAPEPRMLAAGNASAGFFRELELRTVLEGVRAVALVDLTPDDPRKTRLKREGLETRRLRLMRRFSGFGHYYVDAAPGDRDVIEHTAVGRDSAALDEVEGLFKGAFTAAAHARVGRLLGYPECCARFFGRVWTQKHAWDPVFETGLATPGAKLARDGSQDELELSGDPVSNVLLRYMGPRLVSWLPCSYRCAASKRRAADWLVVGRRIHRPTLDGLLRLLAVPLTWRSAGGALRVEGPFFTIRSRSYAAERVRVLRWSAR